jgi:hypothetical protein
MRFQVLFHSPLGVLFTFPSRYWFAIGHRGVLSLGRWASRIHAGFPVTRATWDRLKGALAPFAYGGLTRSAAAFQRASARGRVGNSSRAPARPGKNVPQPRLHNGCSLDVQPVWARPRSLAATGGVAVCFPFLGVLRCFSSPGWPPTPMHSAPDRRGLPGGVAPFGDPRIHLLPVPRGLSQVAASFVASRCQGIHRTLLLAWPKNRHPSPSPSLRGGSCPRFARGPPPLPSKGREGLPARPLDDGVPLVCRPPPPQRGRGRRVAALSSLGDFRNGYPCIQLSNIRWRPAVAPAAPNPRRVPRPGLASRLSPRGESPGGDDRDRTDGLRLAKPALSQLSYIPRMPQGRRAGVVGPSRIELPTSRLSGVRSSQLSYGPRPEPPPKGGPARAGPPVPGEPSNAEYGARPGTPAGRLGGNRRPSEAHAIDLNRVPARTGCGDWLLRKEVIQPHLPIRLPCYDFIPLTRHTFGASPPLGLGQRLRVHPTRVM